MSKRKAEDSGEELRTNKKVATEKVNGSIGKAFRDHLFTETAVQEQKRLYEQSEPYLHGVISNLINDDLLRNVRSEIQENVSFMPKETDIYKIHQSGDLANLDGLDDGSLQRLPSLKRLRDALYSPEFRQYLCTITGSRALSGTKTDMAINVYTPTCHLLCHDDVIGSRRVSYILYLSDPDVPWREEWGGALRLYPTREVSEPNGEAGYLPEPEHSKSIPPAFNQLSFFAVQPGRSFHDVEEVYAPSSVQEGEGKRVRMAISGWFHVPQEGEDGYLSDMQEDEFTKKSSLAQLQGRGEHFDRPIPKVISYPAVDEMSAADDKGKSIQAMDPPQAFSEEDLNFLLQYIAPSYLTPDTLDSVRDTFTDECSIELDKFLSSTFSERLRSFITAKETQLQELQDSSWDIARPPHKHRYLFQQSHTDNPDSPVQEILQLLIPSIPFRKWLQLATGHTITTHSALARRFRRGKDYTLAQNFAEEDPRLEVCLAVTPSTGWIGDAFSSHPEPSTQSSSTADKQPPASVDNEVGGYLAYMAGDDDGEDEDAKRDKKTKADPAIYRRNEAEDEDDGVLFSMPAGWNKLALVLRDKGTLRFVKYVSRSARGDRWDVVGEFGIEFDEENEGDEDGGAKEDEEEEEEDEEDEDEDEESSD